MRASLTILSILAVAIAFAAFQSFFIVAQQEQALVLRFGRPVNIIQTPGLHFKMPLTDSVERFDRRLITLNAEPKAIILRDQDRLVVDAFVTYRITDPLTFFQTVRNERTMNSRLESILEKSLRDTLGKENLSTLLSPRRSGIMLEIKRNVSRQARGLPPIIQNTKAVDEAVDTENQATTETTPLPIAPNTAEDDGFGIEIVDVRIMRTDLPDQTSTPIYQRMRSERQKVAERYRAEGKRESEIIRSQADKERTVLLAEAERQSSILRGQGDAEATRIYGKAFSVDPDFYEFYKALEAYRSSLNGDNTTMILSPNSPFLKQMQRP